MSVIGTTVVDGHVHVPVPDGVPNGTEVEVSILPLTSEPKPGDGEWDDSQDGIDGWLKQYDAFEPLVLNELDRAEKEPAFQEPKDWEKSRFSDHAEKQENLWE